MTWNKIQANILLIFYKENMHIKFFSEAYPGSL